MKQNFWSFIMALMLITGLFACSDDKGTTTKGDDSKGTTYMGIAISVPQVSNSLKAGDDGDYNPFMYFSGATGIQTVDIYLLSADGNTLLESRRFNESELVIAVHTTAQGEADAISLQTPFKTTPGNKKMIVVVNSPLQLFNTVPADDFRYTLSPTLALSDLAKVSATPINIGGKDYYLDILVLSGKSEVFTIQDGVSALEVKNDQKNLIAMDIVRVPSRTIITTTASATVTSTGGQELGTISNLTYSVAQGANSVYLFPQTSGTSPATTTVTWGYNYLPGVDYMTNSSTYYDYSDLRNTTDAIPAKPAQTDDLVLFPGKFLLENTHPRGADINTSGYKKGNTAYVLVRAKFTPAPAAITDNGTLAADGTFYVGGADGRIYTTVAAAQNVAQGGTAYQRVAKYDKGKVLYYVWLNPNSIAKPVNSPVVRNHIYHINITGFKSIGYNWNPLTPDPNNPDPKPGGGDEPDSPIDPKDPLSSTDTYMSVDITIVPWTIHSYDVEL